MVVAPCHPGDEPERRDSLHREVGVGAKRGSKPPHGRPGAKVRYDTDEVAAVGIEKPEQRRVPLTTWFAAVAPYGLKRCHQPDVVPPTPGRLGVHPASLLASPKKWRLFIDEGDKSDCQRRRCCAAGPFGIFPAAQQRHWHCHWLPDCQRLSHSARPVAKSRCGVCSPYVWR